MMLESLNIIENILRLGYYLKYQLYSRLNNDSIQTVEIKN